MEYGGLLPTNKVDMSLYFTALDAGYGPTHTAPAPFTAHLESYYLRLQTEISQSGSSMDAEGRKRYTAAWKVVNDNMFLQDVWKKSQSLRDLVDKIFQQLDKLIFSKTPDERIQSLNDILQPLFQARIKHAAEIRTLLDIENSTQRVDIESRIVLLAWNNGTRIFTREIWKIADSELKNSRNSRIVSRYRQEMIELEACRFLLWVEGELVGVDVVSTFENEHKVLDAAYAAVTQGKSDTVKSQLASIVLESSLSLFAEGIATILSSTLNQADFGAVDTGLNLLKAIEDALEVYYDSGEAGSMSAIIKWKKPFQGWKNVGAQIRKMVIGRVTQDNV